eukprot:7245893-Prymnesium_polylepis.1
MSHIDAHLRVRSNTSQRARRSDITVTRLTHRSQQSYSACRQQHGKAAICAPSPGVRAASASDA